MNSTDAKRAVVTTLVVTGGLVLVRDIARGTKPKLRFPLGLAIAGVVLAAGAEVAPDVAGPFAVLVLVGAVFFVGVEGFGAIGKAVGTTAGTGGGAPVRQL